MQRYHLSNCTGAVNNNTIGGASYKDTVRAVSSSLPANFPISSRLGPPDFHPQTPNYPEETLTKEYVQFGYRKIVEGLESLRKYLRAINESHAQKRKAGQVYGVPISGSLLTKPGVFLEQRACGEDFKKKWIEGLSQPHKRLHSLVDHVPHGYRKKSLFEVLIRNKVLLLRYTWFIKVTYLNQVRPSSASISSSTIDKNQFLCIELWIQQPAADQPNTATNGPGHDDVVPSAVQDDHPHSDSPSAHGGGFAS